MQRAAQVGAVVGQHVDVRPAPEHEQAQVAELAADRPAVGQVVDRAHVMPAQPGQVADGLGVVGPGPEPQGQVPAQVAADRGRGQAAGRQRLADLDEAGDPGDQRGGEQGGRAGPGGGVYQPDPLLVPVQRGPVGQPGGGGRQRAGDPGRDQRAGRPLGAREQVEQGRRRPAAQGQPDQGRVRRLAERHAMQGVGPRPGRQRADHAVGQRPDRPVQGGRAFDALGHVDGPGDREPAAGTLLGRWRGGMATGEQAGQGSAHMASVPACRGLLPPISG